MEAHHLRPEGLDYRAICVIEGGPICGSHPHLWIDIELGIVALQSLAPLAIDNRVISRRSMAKEIHVDGSGTVLTTNAHFGDWRKTLTPTCDGRTMTWNTTSIQIWTLTPNPDWQTALVTGTDPGSLFGFGAFNSSATFRKTSP